MLVLFKQLYYMRVLTQLTRRVAFLAKMSLSVFITSQNSDFLDRVEDLVTQALHFIDVCVAPFINLLNYAVFHTFHIDDAVGERDRRISNHVCVYSLSY